ncbi:MAG: phasin family protein [Limnohabitans sp.]
MAKKPDPATAPTSGLPDLSALSSHQIWLAGLGAMAQAQAQGSKAIETLVSDGLAFQRKSQEEARQRFEEATERLTSMAQGLGQQTAGRIDKLEQVFEERVARALHRLGMPTLQDIAELQARVADLEAQLARRTRPAEKPATASSTPTAAKAAPRSSSRAPARKAPRKG